MSYNEKSSEFNLVSRNIEKINQMIDTQVGLIDSLLNPHSTEESKH